MKAVRESLHYQKILRRQFLKIHSVNEQLGCCQLRASMYKAFVSMIL